MLTKEQQAWIDTLSDKEVHIVPFDPRTEKLFNQIERKIHEILGLDVVVEHCGASSFGISGQDEIDVSIVTSKEKFAEYIPKIEKLGPVKQVYPDRVRFSMKEEGKKNRPQNH